VDENSVEAYISFLRKNLDFLASDLRIITVRMLGYRLEKVDESEADESAAADVAGADAAGADESASTDARQGSEISA
jgi:DNA-binding winged helix-turn-helix (wHTH) protein